MLLSQELLCDQPKKYLNECAASPGQLSPASPPCAATAVPPAATSIPILPSRAWKLCPCLGLGCPWVLPSPVVVTFHLGIVVCGSVVCGDLLLTFLPSFIRTCVCLFEGWCVFMRSLLVGATLPRILLSAIPRLHH